MAPVSSILVSVARDYMKGGYMARVLRIGKAGLFLKSYTFYPTCSRCLGCLSFLANVEGKGADAAMQAPRKTAQRGPAGGSLWKKYRSLTVPWVEELIRRVVTTSGKRVMTRSPLKVVYIRLEWTPELSGFAYMLVFRLAGQLVFLFCLFSLKYISGINKKRNHQVLASMRLRYSDLGESSCSNSSAIFGRESGCFFIIPVNSIKRMLAIK